MKLKTLFLIALLMFVFLAGIFIYKARNIFYNIEDEILVYLENLYQIDIDVRESFYWPINQIILKDVRINLTENRSISVPEIVIYYDFFKFLKGVGDVTEAIEMITIEKPHIKIIADKDEYFFNDINSDNLDQLFEQCVDIIYSISPFQLTVEEGELSYYSQDNQLTLAGFDISLNVLDRKECQLKLETALYIDRIKVKEYDLTDVVVNNIQIIIALNDYTWQGILETDYLDSKALYNFLTDTFQVNDNYHLSISELSGQIKPLITFSGSKSLLESCSGKLSLNSVQSVFSLSENMEQKELLPKENLFILKEMMGSINFDSEQKFISINDMEFFLNGDLFKLSASLDISAEGVETYGHLRSNKLNLMNLNLIPEEIKIDGLAAIDITMEGLFPNLNLNLHLSLAEGNINDIKIENLVSRVRFYQGNTYLDQLNFLITENGQFSANGIYNKNQSYTFSIKGQDIDLEVLNYLDISGGDRLGFPGLKGITGRISMITSLTGNEPGLDKLSANGQIEIVEPCIILSGVSDGDNELESKISFSQMKSNFYITDERFFLQDGQIIDDWIEIALSGEIGLANKDIKMEINSDRINLMGIANVLVDDLLIDNIDDIKLRGEMQVKGLLKGYILDPLLELDIYSKEGSYSGIRYDDLLAKLNYYNKEISIEGLNFNYNDTPVFGNAIIYLESEAPRINGTIFTDKFDYNLLTYGNINTLPIEGSSKVDLVIDGLLSNPEISVKAESNDTSININNRKIKADKMELSLEKQADGFLLKDLFLLKEDSELRVTGIISDDELELKYSLLNFSLEYLPLQFELAEDVFDGYLDLTGSITGSLSAPLVSAYVKIQDLIYGQKELGLIAGNIYYDECAFIFDNLIWKNQKQKYIIGGKIENVLEQPALDIILSTDYGQISDLFFLKLDEKIEKVFSEHYYFTGLVYLTGGIDNISSELDIQIINNINPEANIRIDGSIAEELVLHIEGNGVPIDKLAEESNIAASGDLYFEGEITGTPDSYNLLINTGIKDAVLAGSAVESIEGILEISNASIFSLQQVVIFSEESVLELSGELALDENLEDIRLNLFLKKFPLELITSYNQLVPEMSGIVSGNIEWSGGISAPILTGELVLNEGKLDLGLPAQFSRLAGRISLEGQAIRLNELNGRYGDGQLQIQGLIEPFAEKNNFDLVIKGRGLPFVYGSIEGRFDGNAKLSGLLENPVIEGTLTAHDLNVYLPFEWPVVEGGMNWQYDLLIYPGDEVYLKNTNIDVLIQEGNLNIHNLDGELELSGELSSTQGVFDYYNNKFILEKGKASYGKSFIESDRYIPELSINAWTNVGGTRINVLLNGKSNNMVATFTSRPPLTEEEIFTLLTSRGGLGEFAAGNFGNILESEFFRWVHSQIQLDFVKNLQENLKKIFELDRFELDTYNWGWNNQVSIYIGKYLNRRLYLEYTDIIGPGNEDLITNTEGELRLQYFFNENIILEGSWLGEDDYSFSIEGNFPF